LNLKYAFKFNLRRYVAAREYPELSGTLRQIASLRMVGSGYVSELLVEALVGPGGERRVSMHDEAPAFRLGPRGLTDIACRNIDPRSAF
jgi:hypothetical protein